MLFSTFICLMKRKSELFGLVLKTMNAVDFAKISLILVCFLSFPENAIAQKVNAYGLTIISDIRDYHRLAIPSHQKLVWVDSLVQPFPRNVIYQTSANFTKSRLYDSTHRFYLIRQAAEALQLVQDSLAKRGLNILVFDTYRPYAVTEKMWEIVPDDRYAANPARGSMHNRGLAIDLSLADLQTGKSVQMPTGFDDFTQKALIDFTDLPEAAIQNRDLLQGVMKHFGFRPITTEWWHFYWPNLYDCPLLNLSFDALK